ncbi:hypothetical protein D9A29_12110, partial [Vibrio parahaemolyticus]|nr:hypothetical protein [Vibrio parahaemolyticus]
EGKIKFSNIEEKMPGFYYELLMGEGLQSAYNTLGEGFILYHSEEMFAKIMINYLESECFGVNREININKSEKSLISKGHLLTEKQKIELRKEAEKIFTPDQEFFQRYLNVFLAGKNVSYSIDDLWSQVENNA